MAPFLWGPGIGLGHVPHLSRPSSAARAPVSSPNPLLDARFLLFLSTRDQGPLPCLVPLGSGLASNPHLVMTERASPQEAQAAQAAQAEARPASRGTDMVGTSQEQGAGGGDPRQ